MIGSPFGRVSGKPGFPEFSEFLLKISLRITARITAYIAVTGINIAVRILFDFFEIFSDQTDDIYGTITALIAVTGNRFSVRFFFDFFQIFPKIHS